MSNPQKIPARIAEISSHGSGVYSVRFQSDRPLPRFKPGQFLHLAIDPFDPSTGYWPESRVFSIATAPTRNEVTIAYSVKGAYTRRIERELKIGSEVWLKYPFGSFIINEAVENGGPAILVAGGTGITPFVSFIDREADAGSGRQITLFYGVRSPDLILFESVLRKAKDHCPNFKLYLYIEELSEATLVSAVAGRLKTDPIIEEYHELGEAPVFLAGPPVMINAFKKAFLASGLSGDKIIIDEWE